MRFFYFYDFVLDFDRFLFVCIFIRTKKPAMTKPK
jgi:hypothetical protein